MGQFKDVCVQPEAVEVELRAAYLYRKNPSIIK